MKILIYTFIFIGIFTNCIEKKNKYIPLVDVVQNSANSLSTAIGVGSAANENNNHENEITLHEGGNSITEPETGSAAQNSDINSADNLNNNTEDSTSNSRENSSDSSSNVNEENEKVESNSNIVNSIYNITPVVSVLMDSANLLPISIDGTLADNQNNTLGQLDYFIYVPDANGEGIIIFTGNSSENGSINGEFSIPSGYDTIYLIVTIDGVNSLPVSIPVSVELECKGDRDRGHGNDVDGIDEDNPGKSTGINANAMENRRSNGRNENDCQSGMKYISKITKITLPI